MRVDHVVLHIDEESAGTTYCVLSLCEGLERQGLQVALHVASPAPQTRPFSFDLQVYPDLAIRRGMHFPRGMKQGLRRAARRTQVIHNHGLWLTPNLWASWAVDGTDCRLVCAPHGALDPWAFRHKGTSKRLMWALFQRGALQRAACYHATAESEYTYIREAGLRAPVAVVPHGIHIPPMPARDHSSAAKRRRLLFLARIHPKKGVDVLLRVWRRLQERFPDWELHITGPDNEGHLKYCQNLAQSLGTGRVTFTGALWGSAKSQAYFDADLYVLPTHSENFAMTVAEALAHGVPAVVSKGAPWAGLEREGCGWWVDLGEEPLHAALGEAMSAAPDELRAMGARGRDWMTRDFSWDEMSRRMQRTYQWLVDGGARPDWIRLD